MAVSQEKVPFNSAKAEYGLIEADINSQTFERTKTNGIFSKFGNHGLQALAAVAVVCVVAYAITFRPQDANPTNLRATSEDAELGDFVDLDSKQGKLRGYIRSTRQGRDYLAFYKVPYAQPPTGKLRFQEPKPASSWEGLRDVKELAPQCLQKVKYTEIVEATGVEDCLYVNVYTPSIQNQSAYPTMVYIHGGGFTDGNGSRYGAEYFLDNDVVLITIQYRLAGLGFLNSEDGVFPGNVGFKDQVMSLKWVKDNIAEYGGDPTRVTIFGDSAGAISVGLHMVSPLSRGLFMRAITQSGANICNVLGLYSNNPVGLLRDVAKQVNCPSNGSTTEIMDCFMSKPASEIATARLPSPSLNGQFGPSVDTQSPTIFLPDTPYKLLKEKKANSVPYIIGVVTAEWVKQSIEILHDPDYVDKLNNNWSEHAQDLLVVKDMGKEELESVKTFYFGEKLIGNETFVNLTNLVSDRTLNHCSYMSAMMHGGVANTYLYYLSKPPAKSYAEKEDPNFNAKAYGILAHGDELQFQFPYSGYPEVAFGDPEYYKFSEYFVRLWTHFAATGDPSGMDGLEWKSTSSASNTFWFELNDKPGQTHVLDERMMFWDQFSKSQLKLE